MMEELMAFAQTLKDRDAAKTEEATKTFLRTISRLQRRALPLRQILQTAKSPLKQKTAPSPFPKSGGRIPGLPSLHPTA